jgi:hypothetical protein
MTEGEINLAKKIVVEMALMTIEGQDRCRETMLTKYGEYGFDLAERYCRDHQLIPETNLLSY